jgi:hypothetical protein
MVRKLTALLDVWMAGWFVHLELVSGVGAS